MLIQNANDVQFLPRGRLSLEHDGYAFNARVDRNYATLAAEFLLELGVCKNFATQSELVAEAVNEFKWDLGQLSYRATL